MRGTELKGLVGALELSLTRRGAKFRKIFSKTSDSIYLKIGEKDEDQIVFRISDHRHTTFSAARDTPDFDVTDFDAYTRSTKILFTVIDRAVRERLAYRHALRETLRDCRRST
jgi:hypothetical protein